jgi:hypothetical protein
MSMNIATIATIQFRLLVFWHGAYAVEAVAALSDMYISRIHAVYVSDAR